MAQPTWRRLSLEVPVRDADVASALLGAVTSEAVVVEQREGASAVTAGVYVRVRVAPPLLQALRARVRELRHEGVLRDAVVRHAEIREEDWSRTWRRSFRPFAVARGLYVTPPWDSKFTPPRGARTLVLDPGMAFGTGLHATTRLAVRLLLPLVKPHDVVIDAGCGSGILGLAAALRGTRVYAFDDDAIAVAATRRNFKNNRLRPAAVARADRIPAAFPKADCIVANITGQTLQELAWDFAAHLKPGGRLVCSGISARYRLATLFAFARIGLAFEEERRSGEWFAYVHRRAVVPRAKLGEIATT